MLGTLTDKMHDLVGRLSGKRQLSEANIADAVREVRLALLEADVNYGVVKLLIKRIKERAIGDAVVKSVSPGEQFIKLVHDELVQLMGGNESTLNVKGSPAVIMLCGLQGSGKTTTCVKLAHYLRKTTSCSNPLIVACDLQRPAAIEQLKRVGADADVSVFSLENEKNPTVVAEAGLAYAREKKHDLLILDTAGRLHVDAALMDELKLLRAALQPSETIFVANAATGQDAVTVAKSFHEQIGISGSILTMLDGNMRGGAAISIREISERPLLFEGIGEKIEDLQPFSPESMADRILGMGDTINLVRRAQEHIDEEDAKDLETKLRKATFTYQDYLKQIQSMKKMGSLKSLLKMMPGMSQMKDINFDTTEFYGVEAIIQSMTPEERLGKDELSIPRRKRIAAGSGKKIDEVNKLVKSFKKAKQFFKDLPSMNKLEKMMGGPKWR